MVDEIYDRHLQEARSELSSAIAGAFGRAGRAVKNTFSVLNRIEYSAPWTASSKKVRCS